MVYYQFTRGQTIKAPLEVVWEFIAAPQNLKTITPPYMGFDIVSKNLPKRMYQGMIIAYKVSPFFGIKSDWVTEITHVRELEYFVDEQRIGPYSFWHHQHLLNKSDEGILMTDIVTYQPPFGVLGAIANKLAIERKLMEIFDYRRQAIEEKFG